ncbi:MAG: hypothetical protein FJW34_11530 [Acidobacteria bacterium]|nr:hypothetical protein [Acidobacteriota bacterium]
MSPRALVRPSKIEVSRSELRRRQSAAFRRAKGSTVLAVTDARPGGEVKYVVDGPYLEQLTSSLRAALETLEVLEDRRLLDRVLQASRTLDADLAQGRLRALDEVFGAN